MQRGSFRTLREWGEQRGRTKYRMWKSPLEVLEGNRRSEATDFLQNQEASAKMTPIERNTTEEQHMGRLIESPLKAHSGGRYKCFNRHKGTRSEEGKEKREIWRSWDNYPCTKGWKEMQFKTPGAKGKFGRPCACSKQIIACSCIRVDLILQCRRFKRSEWQIKPAHRGVLLKPRGLVDWIINAKWLIALEEGKSCKEDCAWSMKHHWLTVSFDLTPRPNYRNEDLSPEAGGYSLHACSAT